MAKQRSSVLKRQREQQKKLRERKKAEKAAEKRERRENRSETSDEQRPDEDTSPSPDGASNTGSG